MSTKDKGIASYLSITFLGAWALWLAGWFIATRFLRISPSGIFFQFLLIPGSFMPAIAAIIVRRWITGEGFADAGLTFSFRKNWKYYLFAGYLLPFAVVGTIVLFSILFRIGEPDFSLHRAFVELLPQTNHRIPRMTPGLWVFLVLQLVIEVVPVATVVTWGEEFGWRGYLQTRLLAERPILAAIATGLLWGLWHYPLIIVGYEHYENVVAGLLVFPMCTVMLSIIFGWLFFRTGSIWSSSIAHGGSNGLGASLTMLLFLGSPHFLFVSYLGILSWIPFGAVCAWIVAHWAPRNRHDRKPAY